MAALEIAIALLLAFGCAYSLFALLCVLRFFSGKDDVLPSAETVNLPPVSILKPLKGLDPLGAENLRTFCTQDYPRYEVLFGFRDPADPALPLVHDLIAAGECDGRVIVSDEGSGPNQKVLNLEALVAAARYPLLAVSDGDMCVHKGYLRQIVGELAETGRTGMVTCLYKISEPATIGSALESYTIALDFMPSVLVARCLEGVTFGLGASMLFSKGALEDIGGLRDIADFLADDYQLGFRLWKKGYTNMISRYVIENRVGAMALADHVLHQTRWARTYRISRPGGYAGYVITHVFFFALLLLILAPSLWSVAALALVLALRYALALAVYFKVIRRRSWLKWLPLVPVKDILSFFVWLWSFAGSAVQWKGISYRLRKGGRMVRVSEPPKGARAA